MLTPERKLRKNQLLAIGSTSLCTTNPCFARLRVRQLSSQAPGHCLPMWAILPEFKLNLKTVYSIYSRRKSTSIPSFEVQKGPPLLRPSHNTAPRRVSCNAPQASHLHRRLPETTISTASQGYQQQCLENFRTPTAVPSSSILYHLMLKKILFEEANDKYQSQPNHIYIWKSGP